MSLRRVESHRFFERARSLAAARRKTSVMERRILLPFVEKAISVLIETTEGKSRYPTRENATTDSPRELFPIFVCSNASWTLPGVAVLVSMARIGKSSQTFYVSGGRLAHAHNVLKQTEILVTYYVIMIIKYKNG